MPVSNPLAATLVHLILRGTRAQQPYLRLGMFLHLLASFSTHLPQVGTTGSMKKSNIEWTLLTIVAATGTRDLGHWRKIDGWYGKVRLPGVLAPGPIRSVRDNVDRVISRDSSKI
ncbi:hypothetical protein B0H11DRAFT_2107762 [Mycena galericulata]|nr:hypothetical protein B0H11DRAFT_2107762 [Mycena galericulata]